MNNALLSGVAGLNAHQKMLDVAGNNLANVNTSSFKSSRVTFADLLSNTIRQASQPTEAIGGTNPQQIGTGVMVASVDRNMGQGSLISTGQPLDMAMEGAGFFVMRQGQQEVYTRLGTFAVDADYFLVDPATGARVQRIGSEGETEGFQETSSRDIRIPFDVALPAQATAEVSYTGNLSANILPKDTPTNELASGLAYTESGAVVSDLDTQLDALDQTSGLTNTDTITVYGFKRDGTELGAGAGVQIDLHDGTDFLTIDELLQAITDEYDVGGTTTSVASMSSGEIRLKDVDSGYSRTDIRLEYTGAGSFELPNYFKVMTAGGVATKSTNVAIFDSQGISHTMSATFVRSNAPNTWDLILTSITGDVELVDRRINDITFFPDGSYGGLGGATPDTSSFQMRFAHEPTSTRTIEVDLGTGGEFDGLAQFGGESTVAPSGQDGYASGWLSNVSVMRDGVLVGAFTNGVRRDLAALRLATFQNPAGLESIGNNYFATSSNSGDASLSKGLSGKAGAVRGGTLERSNVEVEQEFVNMIQAQNGFQANALTIRVANEVLRELTNLIR